MDTTHVCMFVERVCMFGENRAPEDEVRFLTKTLNICQFNSFFEICEILFFVFPTHSLKFSFGLEVNK